MGAWREGARAERCDDSQPASLCAWGSQSDWEGDTPAEEAQVEGLGVRAETADVEGHERVASDGREGYL